MKYILYLFAASLIVLSSCQQNKTVNHSSGGHVHDDVKFQITAYSYDFEVFAESDPLVTGHNTNILAHFTWLKDFSALDHAKVTANLKVNGKMISAIKDKSLRPGIYRFKLKPEEEGKAEISFQIEYQNKNYLIKAGTYQVFNNEHDAIHWAEDQEVIGVNSVVFTKEQSWKVDFRTELPEIKEFGNIIKTTALAEPCHEGEINISAKSNGIIQLQSKHYAEGMQVKKGEEMFLISGNELAENNSSVRYLEAKNNYEKAQSNLRRAENLAKDQLINQKELIATKNDYENARAIFENMSKNFNASGQVVKSPIDGYINWMDFENGNYVETGDPLLAINNGKRLVLKADVRGKYMRMLPYIQDVKIKIMETGEIIDLEEINGELLSYGKTTNSDNYLVPVVYEVDNVEEIISGNFVELYLQCAGSKKVIVIPTSSILEEQGNYFVFVQLTPELFEKQEVKIGATNGKQTEILSGLNATERIVSVGGVLIKLSKATGGLDAHSGHVH